MVKQPVEFNFRRKSKIIVTFNKDVCNRFVSVTHLLKSEFSAFKITAFFSNLKGFTSKATNFSKP